ncbi:uncharacterized protein LOC135333506 [Halichondria panicea]|uniref:uncharacterized protein LOC135333506 n=1 Tax=Halichondria panicea TaxID=6063 RepID=UPI00312B550F
MVLPKPNFSYYTYVYIESLPILGVPILVLILGSLFTCRVCHNDPKDTFLDIFYGPPLAVLTNTPGTEGNKKKFYIGKYEISRRVSWCLYFIGMLFIPSSFIVFWDLFVFTESQVCDDLAIDCFSPPSHEIVNNCTDYKDLDVEFICFRFTFSFGIGLAAAGGVFTALQLIVKIISRSSIWFNKRCSKRFEPSESRPTTPQRNKNLKYCQNCVYVLISGLAITASIAAFVLYGFYLFPYYLYEHYPFSKLIACHCKFGIFVVTFATSFCTPWHTKPQQQAANPTTDQQSDQLPNSSAENPEIYQSRNSCNIFRSQKIWPNAQEEEMKPFANSWHA